MKNQVNEGTNPATQTGESPRPAQERRVYCRSCTEDFADLNEATEHVRTKHRREPRFNEPYRRGDLVFHKGRHHRVIRAHRNGNLTLRPLSPKIQIDSRFFYDKSRGWSMTPARDAGTSK